MEQEHKHQWFVEVFDKHTLAKRLGIHWMDVDQWVVADTHQEAIAAIRARYPGQAHGAPQRRCAHRS